MDYMFDHKFKYLSIMDCNRGRGDATAVENKGLKDHHAERWCIRQLQNIGYDKFTLQADAEPAIQAFIKMCSSKVQGKEIHCRCTPSGSHQSNGQVERWHQTLQGQVKALLLEAQVRFNLPDLSNNWELLSWVVRHAAWLIQRFQPYLRGKTPHEIKHGKKYESDVCCFGECVMCLETVSDAKRDKFKSRWLSGMWLGRLDISDEHLVYDVGSKSIKRFRTIRRHSSDVMRWSYAEHITNITLTPWLLKVEGGATGSTVPWSRPGLVPAAKAADVPEEQQKPVGKDPTPGCLACSHAHGYHHSAACKKRKGAMMEEAELDRNASKESAQKRQSVAPAATAAAEDSMDLDEEGPSLVRRRIPEKRAPMEHEVSESGKKPKILIAEIMGDTNEEEDDLDWEQFFPPEELKKGRDKEVNSLYELKTFRLVPETEVRKAGHKVIGTRWVDRWRQIPGDDKEVQWEVKSRLVAMDFTDGKKSVETYSATPGSSSLKIILVEAAIKELEQKLLRDVKKKKSYTMMLYDIKVAFLNSVLDKAIYCRPPKEIADEYEARTGVKCLMELLKGLYGLKRASNLWRGHFNGIMKEINFIPLDSDECLYYNADTNSLVYVDDGILHGDRDEVLKIIEELKKRLSLNDKLQEIRNVGDKGKFLNRVIKKTPDGYSLTGDVELVKKLLKEMGMQKCRAAPTPWQDRTRADEEEVVDPLKHSLFRTATGIILYISHDRQDIQYAAKCLSKCLHGPTEEDFSQLKRVCRYLRGRPEMEQLFEFKVVPRTLTTPVDSNWAGEKPSMKSTSGGAVRIGEAPEYMPVISSWSRNQGSVALSTAEAELYGIGTGTCEALHVQQVFQELGRSLRIKVQTDASAAKAALERNAMKGMRHIQIRHMFMRSLIKDKKIQIEKIPGVENIADLNTKGTTTAVQETLLKLLPYKFHNQNMDFEDEVQEKVEVNMIRERITELDRWRKPVEWRVIPGAGIYYGEDFNYKQDMMFPLWFCRPSWAWIEEPTAMHCWRHGKLDELGQHVWRFDPEEDSGIPEIPDNLMTLGENWREMHETTYIKPEDVAWREESNKAIRRNHFLALTPFPPWRGKEESDKVQQMMRNGIGRRDVWLDRYAFYKSDVEMMATLVQRVKDTTRDQELCKVPIDDMLAYEIEVNPIAWGFFVMDPRNKESLEPDEEVINKPIAFLTTNFKNFRETTFTVRRARRALETNYFMTAFAALVVHAHSASELVVQEGISRGLAVHSFGSFEDMLSFKMLIGMLVLAMLAGIIIGWQLQKFAMRFQRVIERVTEVPETPEFTGEQEKEEEVDEATIPDVVAGDALWKEELKIVVKAEELSKLSNAELMEICNMRKFKVGARPTKDIIVELLCRTEDLATGPQMRYMKVLARKHGVILEPKHYASKMAAGRQLDSMIALNSTTSSSG